MDGGNINVARALPIDAALVDDVLLHLRRDTPGSAITWTLGERGSAEVDVDFFPVFFGFVANTTGPAWTTTARLWDPAAIAVVHVVVELTTIASDACELTIRPAGALSSWWSARETMFLDIALAALDELSEELLWHATRPGVAAG
jgi:hypothetical protein